MEDLKNVLAENLIKYRKAANLTQAELAEIINYSDKAVSKWERAAGMPDVDVLKQIADLFGVTVDDMLTKSDKPARVKRKINLLTRTNVTICSVLLVWLVATAIFVFTLLAAPEIKNMWLAFVYAVPASCIVLLVFNCIWGKPFLSIVIITGLIFSLAAAIYVTVPFRNSWLLFIFCIPLELLNIIYFSLMIKNKSKPKK
ncbi:MAG: helix-turn-helix domain-containing protein [Eubacteriales bacterium]